MRFATLTAHPMLGSSGAIAALSDLAIPTLGGGASWAPPHLNVTVSQPRQKQLETLMLEKQEGVYNAAHLAMAIGQWGAIDEEAASTLIRRRLQSQA